MFNDKFGLTDAVLQGRKTMTRRMIPKLLSFDPRLDSMVWGVDNKNMANIAVLHIETYKYSIYPQYQPGEVVAVAQSYKDLGYTKKWVEQHISPNPNANWNDPFEKKYPGWSNKMFVPAELNKAHQIRITDIKVERLQDISDEDIMKEGITYIAGGGYGVRFGENYNTFALNPMVAFAVLIDNISGKGTWERNPYVFAYSFRLIK